MFNPTLHPPCFDNFSNYYPTLSNILMVILVLSKPIEKCKTVVTLHLQVNKSVWKSNHFFSSKIVVLFLPHKKTIKFIRQLLWNNVVGKMYLYVNQIVGNICIISNVIFSCVPRVPIVYQQKQFLLDYIIVFKCQKQIKFLSIEHSIFKQLLVRH